MEKPAPIELRTFTETRGDGEPVCPKGNCNNCLVRGACGLTAEDFKAWAKLMAENRPVPSTGRRLKDHVELCLWELARLANLASLGKKFRSMEFGFHLGRAQELLDSRGGVAAWWGLFEPMVARGDWALVQCAVSYYLRLLHLAQPPAEFVAVQ
jgi:hypothetical protein